MKKRSVSLSLFFFVVGIFFLIGLINKVGPEQIVTALTGLGFNIVSILLWPVLWYFLQSLAWYRLLEDDGIRVPLFHLFLIKLTGEAINTVTPVSFMAGDPYRIYLLQKKTSKTVSLVSVIIDRTMQSLATILLLMMTVILALFTLPLGPKMEILLPLITLATFAVLLLAVIFQKRGIFRILTNLAVRLKIKKEKLLSLREKIEGLDEQIRHFYQKHKIHFFEILTLHFLARLVGVIEIYLIAIFLGLPLAFSHCLFLTSLTILINIAFVFIPGSIGVLEGSYGALFYLFKLNPVYGVTIQLVRRIRAIVYTFLGLLIILFYKPSLKQTVEKYQEVPLR